MAGEFVSDPVEPIHQFRKAIKRLRALVRLGSTEDEDAVRKIDRKLRDIGRSLGDARDAEVVKRTAMKLCDDDQRLSKTDFEFARSDVPPDRRLVEALTDRLDEVSDELDPFITGAVWSVEQIRTAIERELDAAEQDMRQFSKTGRDEAAHDWRKRVQRCANQLRLVEAIVPILTADQRENLNRTAELLGDYNDLTVLRWALQSSRNEMNQRSHARFHSKAKRQQRKLRQQVLEAGESFGV
jgi:CHAD domain-containing protein